MINNTTAKRVWFITDTHLGVKNNSNEWIEMMREYFFDWFFPMIEKEYQEGDVLLHLGDWYDSRQSINLKVLNLGIDIAEKMSEIFKSGIYVLVGNHDLWGKSTNDVNSLKTIKWIPNLTVLEEPTTLNLGNKTFAMMPWRKDADAERETLNDFKVHDYLCCHTDIRGLKFNRYSDVDKGIEIDTVKKFGRVYSGHIHYSQKSENVIMLGSPYEITRSDMDNPKFILRLDLETGKETAFRNNFSPKYMKMLFTDILESTPEELNEKFKNNFIDVMIDPKMALGAPLNILTDEVESSRSITFHPFDPDKAKGFTSQMYDSEGKQFNVLEFIKEYIKMQTYDDSTKNKLLTSLTKLYKKAINED